MDNRINIAEFVGGTTGVYSDYEELAFTNPRAKWLEHTFKAVQEIAGAFARDKPDPKAFMDLTFYSAVHVLSALHEVHGRVSERTVKDVVETAAYTLDLVRSNDHVVKSGVDWGSPDAYAEWWQSA